MYDVTPQVREHWHALLKLAANRAGASARLHRLRGTCAAHRPVGARGSRGRVHVRLSAGDALSPRPPACCPGHGNRRRRLPVATARFGSSGRAVLSTRWLRPSATVSAGLPITRIPDSSRRSLRSLPTVPRRGSACIASRWDHSDTRAVRSRRSPTHASMSPRSMPTGGTCCSGTTRTLAARFRAIGSTAGGADAAARLRRDSSRGIGTVPDLGAARAGRGTGSEGAPRRARRPPLCRGHARGLRAAWKLCHRWFGCSRSIAFVICALTQSPIGAAPLI